MRATPGKTSFAKQLRLVATGHRELVETLGFEDEVPSDGFRHPSIYFECTDFVSDVQSLLGAMVADGDKLYGFGQFFDGTLLSERTASASTEFAAKFSGVGFGATDGASERRVPVPRTAFEVFRALSLEVAERSGWPLVVVVDELERLKDRRGLASIIKSVTHVRFVLVGVAEDFQTLLDDHESVERQLSDGLIKLPPMSLHELREIFSKASPVFEGRFGFHPEAIEGIVTMANGFPHFVHLIAREAGYVALDAGASTVVPPHVTSAVQQIVAAKKAPRYETMFQKAVGGSASREIVLKAFADSRDEEIHTSDLYPLCESLGVTNPSQHVGTLSTGDGVLVKVRERYYRFADERFRTYVRIRSWKFK